MRIELSTAPGCPNAAARTVLVDCLTARGIDELRRRAAGAPIKFCIAGVEAAFDGELRSALLAPELAGKHSLE